MLLVQVITIYIILSFSEWFMHSKIMHGDPDFLKKVPIIGEYLKNTAIVHSEHHKHVEQDMTLSSNKGHRDLFLAWETCLVISITTLPLFYIFVTRNVKTSFILGFSLLVFYAMLWNNIHVDMHKSPLIVNWKEGFKNKPGSLSNGPIYDFLRKYHTVHHLQKGTKYNHNIVLPGMDHLFGTYQEFYYDNEEYCEKNHLDTRCFENKNDTVY